MYKVYVDDNFHLGENISAFWSGKEQRGKRKQCSTFIERLEDQS